jgi:hypothetical protein
MSEVTDFYAHLAKLKELGVYSFKNQEFEVTFKVEPKVISPVASKVPDVTVKSLEEELYKDLDQRVDVPQLVQTV